MLPRSGNNKGILILKNASVSLLIVMFAIGFDQHTGYLSG